MITSRLVVLEILRGVNSTSKLLTVHLGNQCHQVCMLAHDVQDVCISTQMPNGTCKQAIFQMYTTSPSSAHCCWPSLCFSTKPNLPRTGRVIQPVLKMHLRFPLSIMFVLQCYYYFCPQSLCLDPLLLQSSLHHLPAAFNQASMLANNTSVPAGKPWCSRRSRQQWMSRLQKLTSSTQSSMRLSVTCSSCARSVRHLRR